MDIPTHYTTLGLTPSAPDAVIRAAYKALALMYHPDKTVHLSPEARSRHASAFRAVQEAYDVLGGPSKRAYDAELKRHGNRVDETRSTFHHAPATPQGTTVTTPKRPSSVRLTTAEEKRMMKAKTEEDLIYFREQRAKQDAEDADMDIVGLRVMLKIWADLADEHREDPSMQAHCARQLEAYSTKIAQRGQEHADRARNMSNAIYAPKIPRSKTNSARTPEAPPRATTSRLTTATPNSGSPRATAPKPPTSRSSAASRKPASTLRQRAEATCTEDVAAREHTRAEDKARKDAAKKDYLHAKADAVRSQKANLRQKAEEKAKLEADRIARVRAKVAPAPKGSRRAGTSTAPDTEEGNRVKKLATKKLCTKCDAEHASFAKWRQCNLSDSTKQHGAGEDDEGFFSPVV